MSKPIAVILEHHQTLNNTCYVGGQWAMPVDRYVAGLKLAHVERGQLLDHAANLVKAAKGILESLGLDGEPTPEAVEALRSAVKVAEPDYDAEAEITASIERDVYKQQQRRD